MAAVIPVKDQQDLMSYPFFSLSKRKRLTPIEYDDGRVKVTITGQDEYGIANIYDADVLIYVASQIMAAQNKGQETSRRIRMSQYDILEFLGKGTGGEQYKRLKEALERLQSTSIKTTIKRENSRIKERSGFSWINDWKTVEQNGRLIAIELELNEWLYDGIVAGKVLTVPRKYFRIESGLERFLFRLCRKVVGNENGQLQMKLRTVYDRSGITRKPGAFKKMIEKIVEAQSVPDYWIVLVQRASTKDLYVCGLSRKQFKSAQEAQENVSFIALDRALINSKKKGN